MQLKLQVELELIFILSTVIQMEHFVYNSHIIIQALFII